MRLNKGGHIAVFVLTGGMGSGKSLALDYFRKRGVLVFSADEIAKRVTSRRGSAYAAIVDFFGREVLVEDGSLDYAKIGGLVFGDKELLKAYMDMLHPHILRAVEREIESALRAKDYFLPFVVLEAPVLFEYGMEGDFDYVILLSCEEEERVRRVMERNGLSRPEVLKRMESQFSDEVKRRGSDFEIVNEGTREELETKLDVLYQKMLDLAKRKQAEPSHE